MTEFRNDAGAVERRFNPASAEFRPELRQVAGSKTPHIQGYGSVFGKLSRNLGGFVEQVHSQAFRSAEAQGFPDVVCRYNHNDDWLLGTTKAGTCILSVDGTGLHYDVEVPNTRAGNDVAELTRRGDVTSSSFAFRVPDGGDLWERSSQVGGLPLRTLLELELVDVAPVNTPAYPDATAFVRSYALGAIESLARQFDADPFEIRDIMEQGKLVSLFKRSDRPSATTTPISKEVTMGDHNASSNNEVTSMTATQGTSMTATRAKISTASKNDLPDSAFAYIEPGGEKDEQGKTKPRSKRHFPIHDAAHVRNALSRIGQGAQFGKEALPKVKAAAKKFGIGTGGDDKRELEDVDLILRAMAEEADLRGLLFEEDDEERAKKQLPPWLQKDSSDTDPDDDGKSEVEPDDSDSDKDDDSDSKDSSGNTKPGKPDKKAGSKAPAKRDDESESEERDNSKNEDEDKPDDGTAVGEADDEDEEEEQKRSAPGQPESKEDKAEDDKEKAEADEEVEQKLAKMENKRRLMELMEKRYDPWFFKDEEQSA